MVYRLFSRFSSLRLPSLELARCPLCAEPAEGHGLCAPCADQLPWLGCACSRCAQPLPGPAPACPRCLSDPPAFSSARAAWQYAFPVGQLVQRFKYRGDMAVGRSLAQLAAGRIEPAGKPDLLVPIPLHWRRFLFERGFNQAQQVAVEFGRQWGVPVNARLLRKVRGTREAQQQLKRAQRLRNLRDSFSVRGEVAGLHIGLVDDVITTGATLETAARTLLVAGASAISAYALARTP